jgi:hypothetical protein
MQSGEQFPPPSWIPLRFIQTTADYLQQVRVLTLVSPQFAVNVKRLVSEVVSRGGALLIIRKSEERPLGEFMSERVVLVRIEAYIQSQIRDHIKGSLL